MSVALLCTQGVPCRRVMRGHASTLLRSHSQFGHRESTIAQLILRPRPSGDGALRAHAAVATGVPSGTRL